MRIFVLDRHLNATATLAYENGGFGARSLLETEGVSEPPAVDPVAVAIAQANVSWLSFQALFARIAERNDA